MSTIIELKGQAVRVSGRFCRIGRLRDEYYESLQDPADFINEVRNARGTRIDLVTFLQTVADRTPKYQYHQEWESAAVLPLTTYAEWWEKQISAKTRNMVRKAQKTGVEIRHSEFNDEFVNGIIRIYNESPVRQGRRFWHYGKSFEAVKGENATFAERSDFLGAYHKGEMIGFAKLVHGNSGSNLMQILSMVAHRDKASTNALIAKAVEQCANKKVPFLHYGMWSRRNMGDFKKHHAFERFEIPRYFVPLSPLGKLSLRCGLHHRWIDRMPEPCLDKLAMWRGKWNAVRYPDRKPVGAVAQLVERPSQE